MECPINDTNAIKIIIVSHEFVCRSWSFLFDKELSLLKDN